MDIQCQNCTYGEGGALLFFKERGLAHVRPYGQSRDTKLFEMDGLPNFGQRAVKSTLVRGMSPDGM